VSVRRGSCRTVCRGFAVSVGSCRGFCSCPAVSCGVGWGGMSEPCGPCGVSRVGRKCRKAALSPDACDTIRAAGPRIFHHLFVPPRTYRKVRSDAKPCDKNQKPKTNRHEPQNLETLASKRPGPTRDPTRFSGTRFCPRSVGWRRLHKGPDREPTGGRPGQKIKKTTFRKRSNGAWIRNAHLESLGNPVSDVNLVHILSIS
jgi:hypothetical protein